MRPSSTDIDARGPSRLGSLIILFALLLVPTRGEAAGPVEDIRYFGRGHFARAQRAMNRGDIRTAIKDLELLLEGRPNAPEAPQARYLLGVALLETGRYERAQKIFAGLVSEYPALIDDHLFFRGKALYLWGNRFEAAQVLAKVDPSGPRGSAARKLRTRALYESTDFATLRKLLEDAEHRDGELDPELGYYLGVARHRTGDAEGAFRSYQKVWREAARSKFAGQALVDAALISQTHATLRGTMFDTPEQIAVLAFRRQLAASKDIRDVLVRIETRLARQKKGYSLRSQIAYARGRTVERRRPGDAVRYYALAGSLAPADLTEVPARALLGTGRVHARLGNVKKALSVFEEVGTRFSGSPEAEEALFTAAELALKNRDHATAERHYQALLLSNPVTPYRPRCLWGLGWVRFRLAKFKEARPFFAALTKLKVQSDLHASSRYWLARTDSELGNVKKAREGFEQLRDQFPLGFYAALAQDQLAEVIPTIGTPTARTSTAAVRDEDAPAVLRQILEYTRLGLRTRARRALVEFDKNRVRTKGPQSEAALHLLARIHDALGHNLQARKIREEYAREYPHTMALNDVVAAAQRAHPLKFEPEIRKAAARFQIPAPLLFALVRTESNFTPRAVSVQNAYGLAQIIMPTAWKVARDIGARRPSRWRLLNDPLYNVTLGAAYLRELLNLFEGSEPLALAAYNAGPAAVNSWTSYRVRKIEGEDRKRKGVGIAPAPDELCEEIPVQETRRYVKAVLARARVYARLYSPPPKKDRAMEAGIPVGVDTEPVDLPQSTPALAEPEPGVRILEREYVIGGGGNERPAAP